MLQGLRRLFSRSLFRRLFGDRVANQTGDGLIQVGTAAHVLFSPEEQPTAAAVALVLAVTMVPYSIIGPFAGAFLDRWPRQRVIMVVDSIRLGLALLLGALILTGGRAFGLQLTIMVLVLVATSLNRFLLAGLQAGTAKTVEPSEYLQANTVMALLGPIGVIIAGIIAGAVRLGTGGFLATHQADAIIFVFAAGTFAVSLLVAARIPRDALGPDVLAAERGPTSVTAVGQGLVEALGHLRDRSPAAWAIGLIGVQRLLYGSVMVLIILMYRNHFHPVTDVEPAIADIGLWVGASGVGFVLGPLITNRASGWWGMRGWIIVLFIAEGIIQATVGAILWQPTLIITGLVLGLASQSLKTCTDTLLHAHCDDIFKGRAFAICDMVYNAALVLAALLVWWVAPADGVSVPVMVGLGLVAVVAGIGFAIGTGRNPQLWEQGAESLRTPAPAADAAQE